MKDIRLCPEVHSEKCGVRKTNKASQQTMVTVLSTGTQGLRPIYLASIQVRAISDKLTGLPTMETFATCRLVTPSPKRPRAWWKLGWRGSIMPWELPWFRIRSWKTYWDGTGFQEFMDLAGHLLLFFMFCLSILRRVQFTPQHLDRGFHITELRREISFNQYHPAILSPLQWLHAYSLY